MPGLGPPVLPGPHEGAATYTVEAAPVLLPILTVAVVLLATPAVRRSARLTARRAALWSAFLCYALMVVAITVFPIAVHPAGYWRGTPWWTMLQPVPFRVERLSFLLNVVMTVPLGVMPPMLWPRLRSLRRIAWCGLCTSVAIESVQLLLGVMVGSRRTVDVNDLIANTAGAMIGWWLVRRAVVRCGT